MHLEGSYLHESTLKRLRVQDPYSLRCAPQIHGPCQEALAYAEPIISRELNAATDNPLTFADTQEAISGGNFHGEALAMAFDFSAIALSELANVSERRLELLLNPHFSGYMPFSHPMKDWIQVIWRRNISVLHWSMKTNSSQILHAQILFPAMLVWRILFRWA